MSHFNKKCNSLIFLGIDKIRKIEYNYPITRLHLTVHLDVLVKIKKHLNVTLKWQTFSLLIHLTTHISDISV